MKLPTHQEQYVLLCAREGKPINAPVMLIDQCVANLWLTDDLTITHAGRRALTRVR